MLAQDIRTVERVVVDRGELRSRPRTMRVSLPYIRLLDDASLASSEEDLPRVPSNGRG
jgi:hypothetical protein